MAILEKVDSSVILVGHSMAGVVISQVAEYIPKKYKSLFIFLLCYTRRIVSVETSKISICR